MFRLKKAGFSKIISNEPVNLEKLKQASKIIKELHFQMQNLAAEGYGPFLAAIYDENGNLVSKAANSVVIENCSNNHAEINAIKEAQMKLATYDLSWLKEFKKRGIAVYGNIEAKLGEVELKQYVQTGKKIYKPERKQQKT